MKVCHLTSVHPPLDNRIFYKECRSLARAGFDVTLIAPGGNDMVIDDVKILSVKKASSRLSRIIGTAESVYEKAVALDAAIYHFHDPELIRYGLKLKKRDKKVIYDVHEDLPRQLLAKYYLPSFTRKPLSLLAEVYEDHAIKQFDHIITVTPLLEKRFLKLNPHTTQVCNFPDLSQLNISDRGWSNRRDEICYVGNITAIRGIREMISAVENTNTRLHLAGTFSPPSLRDEIIQMNGWKNAIEHGYANRDKVGFILSSCKAGLVLLHPVINYVDAYPVKLFEYMAAGIPVIASDFPLWKEIVEKHRCGICVDPLNVRGVAEAINYLLSHDAEAQQMGEKGRKAAISFYNWQQEEKKLVTIYQVLMANPIHRRTS